MVITTDQLNTLLHTKEVRRAIEIVCSRLNAYKKRIERDDLIQQSYLIIISNIEVINNSFSGDPVDFVRFCLKNHLLNFIRPMRRDAIYYSADVMESADDENNELEPSQEMSIDALSACEFLEKYVHVLSEIEKEVLYMLYHCGMNGREIGKVFNVSQQRIDAIKQSAINKMRGEVRREHPNATCSDLGF